MKLERITLVIHNCIVYSPDEIPDKIPEDLKPFQNNIIEKLLSIDQEPYSEEGISQRMVTILCHEEATIRYIVEDIKPMVLYQPRESIGWIEE